MKYTPFVFFSFQIPRLGKEFDLLQIKDEQIVNIELKSGAVSDETIRKQLTQNRYYLSVLGRPIYSYTYISSQNRLVRLTNHDHIVEADWTGSSCAGTGKTLLLYDIAMKLSQKHKVCMIHCGEAGKNGRFYMNDYVGLTFGRIIRKKYNELRRLQRYSCR